MLFVSPLLQSDELYRTIDAELKAFLLANLTNLKIREIKIGQGNNIFFSDKNKGVNFIEKFNTILALNGCDDNYSVEVHGHHSAAIDRKGTVTQAAIQCIHYKITSGRSGFQIGEVTRSDIPKDTLTALDEAVKTAHQKMIDKNLKRR